MSHTTSSGLFSIGQVVVRTPLRVLAFDVAVEPDTRERMVAVAREDKNDRLEIWSHVGDRPEVVASLEMPAPVTALAFGDFDDCGQLEVAVTMGPSNWLDLYRLSRQAGRYVLVQLSTAGDCSTQNSFIQLLAGDVDGDGVPEIVGVNKHGVVMWFKSTRRGERLHEVFFRRQYMFQSRESQDMVFAVALDVCPEDRSGVLAAACWDNTVRVKTLREASIQMGATELAFTNPVYAVAAKAWEAGAYVVTAVDITGHGVTLYSSGGRTSTTEFDLFDTAPYGVYSAAFVEVPNSKGIGLLLGFGNGWIGLYLLDPSGDTKPTFMALQNPTQFLVRRLIPVTDPDGGFTDIYAHVERESGAESIELLRLQQSRDSVYEAAKSITRQAGQESGAKAEQLWVEAYSLWEQVEAMPPSSEVLTEARDMKVKAAQNAFLARFNAFHEEIAQYKAELETAGKLADMDKRYKTQTGVLEAAIRACDRMLEYLETKSRFAPSESESARAEVSETLDGLLEQRYRLFVDHAKYLDGQAQLNNEWRQYRRAKTQYLQIDKVGRATADFFESVSDILPKGFPDVPAAVSSTLEEVHSKLRTLETLLAETAPFDVGEPVVDAGTGTSESPALGPTTQPPRPSVTRLGAGPVHSTYGNVHVGVRIEDVENSDGTATLKVILKNESPEAASNVRLVLTLVGQAASFEQEGEDPDKEVYVERLPGGAGADSEYQTSLVVYPLLGGSVTVDYELSYVDYVKVFETPSHIRGRHDGTARVVRYIDGRPAREVSRSIVTNSTPIRTKPAIIASRLDESALDEMVDMLLMTVRQSMIEIFGIGQYVPVELQKQKMGSVRSFGYQAIVYPASGQKRGVIEVSGRIRVTGAQVSVKGYHPQRALKEDIEEFASLLSSELKSITDREALECAQCGIHIRRVTLDDVRLDMLSVRELKERAQKREAFPETHAFVKGLSPDGKTFDLECPYCGSVGSYKVSSVLRA